RRFYARHLPILAFRLRLSPRYHEMRTSQPEGSMSERKEQRQAAQSPVSEAITNNIRVEVESQYAPERSRPFQNEWFFHYTVRITNEGDQTVQLLSRHWIVTDGCGNIEEYKGAGVVGEQPVL